MKKDFIFGVATSSYQIEGTNSEFLTIWDKFAMKENAIDDGSNGVLACDHYNLYEEDIKLIKELGVSSYRLSISWARINPKKGEFSKEGIAFYKRLFERFREENIALSITLYHWDMPLWVYLENNGWVSSNTVDYFLEYAKVCFDEFDEYAMNFATINEPFCVCALGYLFGIHAPGHKSKEEFIKSLYYVYLAHGKVVEYYHKNYDKEIGIVLNQTYDYSQNDDELSKIAVRGSSVFHNLIYLDPLFKGNFPKEFIDLLVNEGIDLSFIKSEELKIIGSKIDFLGINFYSRNLVKYNNENFFNYESDFVDTKKTDMGWEIYPDALRMLIKRIREEYTDIPIYITENGAAFKDVFEDGKINDIDRVDYFKKHLELVMSIKDKYDIRGYYAWSLLDNFEWSYGYEKRFGIVYVDYKNLKRYKKSSYYFYRDFIKNSTERK